VAVRVPATRPRRPSKRPKHKLKRNYKFGWLVLRAQHSHFDKRDVFGSVFELGKNRWAYRIHDKLDIDPSRLDAVADPKYIKPNAAACGLMAALFGPA
jgi:hypothetical protein